MLGNAHTSPQVVNSLAKASGLATKLRKAIARVEIYQKSNIPVPVKLTKRAQVILDQVDEWEGQNVQMETKCPMRFTPQLYKKTNMLEHTPGSPGEHEHSSSIFKWGFQPLDSSSKSSGSMNKKMKNKYKNQWDNLQKRQLRLYESN